LSSAFTSDAIYSIQDIGSSEHDRQRLLDTLKTLFENVVRVSDSVTGNYSPVVELNRDITREIESKISGISESIVISNEDITSQEQLNLLAAEQKIALYKELIQSLAQALTARTQSDTHNSYSQAVSLIEFAVALQESAKSQGKITLHFNMDLFKQLIALGESTLCMRSSQKIRILSTVSRKIYSLIKTQKDFDTAEVKQVLSEKMRDGGKFCILLLSLILKEETEVDAELVQTIAQSCQKLVFNP
jgi:hypothetical protein